MGNSTLLNTGPVSWLLLAALLAVAAAVSRGALNGRVRDVLLAGVRALAQLGVVALVIAQLTGHPGFGLLFVALMFLVASYTSGRRVDAARWWLAGLPVAAGALPVGLAMFATGVLPWNALALIAVLGQQIGGAMTATTLSGRRTLAELAVRRGEVEAAVALGFQWREARTLVAREVAGESLVPLLDQTRTVGTVTLPGAFVGLILGGASPLDAGLIQLLVLISLLAVYAIAAAVAQRLCTAGAWRTR